MTWTPYPNPNGLAPPPPTQNFLEGADAGGGGSGPVGATINADDGMGDTPVPSSQTYPTYTSLGVDCKGQHLQSGYSGSVIKLPTRTMTVTYSGGGNGNGGFGYEVDPNPRGVTIGFSSNKKVPALDKNGNQTSDANGDLNFVAASNDLKHGDTQYSYNTYSLQQTPQGSTVVTIPHLNTLTFTPGFMGAWHVKNSWYNPRTNITSDVIDVVSPDTWKWTPNNSQDDWTTGICQMHYAPNFNYGIDGNPDGSDSPTKYTVKYSATDNQDTSHTEADATLDLQVHDPLENNYTPHKQTRRENIRPAPGTAWLTCTYANEPLTFSYQQGGSWQVTGQVSGAIGTWVTKLTGITVSASLQRSFTWSAGVQGQVPAGVAKIGDSTYLEAYDVFDYQYGKVDTWGTAGYTGTQPYQNKFPNSIPGGFQVHSPLVNIGSGPLPPLT